MLIVNISLIIINLTLVAIFPISTLFIVIIGIVINNEKIIIYNLALFLAFIGLSINPDGNQLGDIIRYYNSYYTYVSSEYGSYSLILQLKFYRLISFYIFELFSINIRFYSFTTVFLISYINMKVTLEFFRDIVGDKKRVLYCIILALCQIPLYVYYSYENVLAISFVYLSSLLFSRGDNKWLIAMTLAILIHNSTVLYLFLFCASAMLNKRSVSIILSVGILCVLLFLSINNLTTGIYFLDKTVSSLYNYFNGSNAHYVNGADYIVLVLSLFKILVFGYFLISYNDFFKKPPFYRTSSLYIMILIVSLYFMFVRMFAVRYVFIGYIIFTPIIIAVLFKLKCLNYKKIILLGLMLTQLLSYINLTYLQSVYKMSEFDLLIRNVFYINEQNVDVPSNIDLQYESSIRGKK